MGKNDGKRDGGSGMTSFPQCTELEAIETFTSFEGRSMRHFAKGQIVWVTNSQESQKRLGVLALARKGKNAASAQYWTAEDVSKYFREHVKPSVWEI